ncbi:PadR family transcriptional regulator [Alteribacter populi]|uniref:PadR family transcriptional regulator n=1 Tax=Alteribacter populi TaxID=2011011 RepID=UPI000BBA8B39|nr:PadR family transcriptional regulator [Alteribacter populi]
MSKANQTKYALLGLLTTKCRTGYAIKQMIDQSLNHFWKISYGQIYPNLKKLVDEDLATVIEATQEGKPDKKEYQITDKGYLALQEWLQQPIRNFNSEKNELLLKLFFSRHQDRQTTIDHLKTYKTMLIERLQTYHSIEQGIYSLDKKEEDAEYWFITLDYGKRSAQACIDWCDATLEKLSLKEQGDEEE